MDSYNLRQITETSWILHKDGVRLALITSAGGELRAMGKLGKDRFKDADDLAKFLGGKVTIEQPQEDASGDELGEIDGYPVKHAAVIPADKVDGLPAYNRGKTQHSAGYYGIKFNHGWVTSYCPKLSTLTGNEYIGPFRTKLEMLNGISQKKRAIEI